LDAFDIVKKRGRGVFLGVGVEDRFHGRRFGLDKLFNGLFVGSGELELGGDFCDRGYWLHRIRGQRDGNARLINLRLHGARID
jgi:hypothetical protein